jgi:hypothetical protein
LPADPVATQASKEQLTSSLEQAILRYVDYVLGRPVYDPVRPT